MPNLLLVENSRHLKHENILQLHFEVVVYLLNPSCRIGYTFEWLKCSQSPLEKGAQCSPLCSRRLLELWDVWMKKKWFSGWNEVKYRLRIGKQAKEKSSVKNCCWLLDENEDICVDLEGYIDTKAPPSPSAVQQSWSRENPGFAQLVTLLILFLSSIHDCLPHPLLTMWHIYLFCLKFNRAQMQSRQTNKFPPSQVEVSAPLRVKAKMLSSPPKLPYLWRAERWCVYLKSSRLWNTTVFILQRLCGELNHFKHICKNFYFLPSPMRWLTTSDSVTRRRLSNRKQEAAGLAVGRLGFISLTSSLFQLVISACYLCFW